VLETHKIYAVPEIEFRKPWHFERDNCPKRAVILFDWEETLLHHEKCEDRSFPQFGFVCRKLLFGNSPLGSSLEAFNQRCSS